MMKTSEHPIPVTRTWFHPSASAVKLPCSEQPEFRSWASEASAASLARKAASRSSLAVRQDRTLLSQCRIELLAVCKTKIVRDRKLTKTSKIKSSRVWKGLLKREFLSLKIQDLVLIFVLEGTQVLETSLPHVKGVPLLGWPTSAARRASWQVADWLSRCG